MLLAILIASTHTHNYLLRKLWKDKDTEIFIVFLCIAYGLLNLFTIKYIVLWTYPLIV